MVHRVANRGGCGTGDPFAHAQRGFFGAGDEFNVNAGQFAETQNRVAVPVGAGDAMVIKLHLLLEHPAGDLDHASFELVEHTVRVDDAPAVHRRHHPFDRHALGQLHFCNDRSIVTDVFVAGKSQTHATAFSPWGGRVPLRAAHHRFNDCACTRV